MFDQLFKRATTIARHTEAPLYLERVRYLEHLQGHKAARKTLVRCAAYMLCIGAEFRWRLLSPHSVRHTTATYLLRAGVDINTIRAWLGHVSLNTTNVYAQIDLEMKSRALAQLEPLHKTPRRRIDSELMEFLRSL